MSFKDFQNEFSPLIEKNLKLHFSSYDFGSSKILGEMISYHMGWRDRGNHGKRLRPLLCLLITRALNGESDNAMPAAIAIEFLHNFTLIHDDIEDRSPIRHGRETLWVRWGEAQAINAGDALFSIAQLAMLNLNNTSDANVAVSAMNQFNQTCLKLTQGQYLDISFETDPNIQLEIYLDMIRGKTAALIAFSASIGGLVSNANQKIIRLLDKFGESLGMAFQIRDDYLGIWGNPEVTGKSTASDLLTRKMTLPVLFGLQACEEFKNIWMNEEFTQEACNRLSSLLESCGAQEYTRGKAAQFTNDAFQALDTLFPVSSVDNLYAKTLVELSENLLGRHK